MVLIISTENPEIIILNENNEQLFDDKFKKCSDNGITEVYKNDLHKLKKKYIITEEEKYELNELSISIKNNEKKKDKGKVFFKNLLECVINKDFEQFMFVAKFFRTTLFLMGLILFVLILSIIVSIIYYINYRKLVNNIITRINTCNKKDKFKDLPTILNQLTFYPLASILSTIYAISNKIYRQQ